MSKLIQGERLGRYATLRPSAAAIIFDEVRQKVLLTRRADNGRWCLPGGSMDPGESAEETCVRELLEETGYRADEVKLLGELAPDTGRLGNRLWGFIAADVKVDPEWRGKTEPGIEVVLCPVRQVAKMVACGKLLHSHDLAVIAVAIAKRLLDT